MAKVVTMGEIMLRLSTPGNEKFIQADEFDVCYGGGEANVAVSLANYGHDAQFVTKVPKNPIGECALAALRKMNVGTKHIAVGGERLGIYFLETGSAMRASNVVYDRAHSSISTALPADFHIRTHQSTRKPPAYSTCTSISPVSGFYPVLAGGSVLLTASQTPF